MREQGALPDLAGAKPHDDARVSQRDYGDPANSGTTTVACWSSWLLQQDTKPSTAPAS